MAVGIGSSCFNQQQAIFEWLDSFSAEQARKEHDAWFMFFMKWGHLREILLLEFKPSFRWFWECRLTVDWGGLLDFTATFICHICSGARSYGVLFLYRLLCCGWEGQKGTGMYILPSKRDAELYTRPNMAKFFESSSLASAVIWLLAWFLPRFFFLSYLVCNKHPQVYG